MKVRDSVVGRFLVERLTPGMGSNVANDELISVRRRLRDSIRSEGAARPGGILDNYLLAKELAHPLSNNASRNITRTSGSERNNKGQRSGRPALRGCWCIRQRNSNKCGENKTEKSVHHLLPLRA